MTHPPAVVEAVARALYGYWGGEYDTLDPHAYEVATALLDQIAPHYREQAARMADRRIADIIRDEGSWEPDTNVTNLPEWAETACEELEAIAAAIRKGE